MKTFNSDDFSYDQIDGTDFVFMRWKVSGRVAKQTTTYHVLGMHSKAAVISTPL